MDSPDRPTRWVVTACVVALAATLAGGCRMETPSPAPEVAAPASAIAPSSSTRHAAVTGSAVAPVEPRPVQRVVADLEGLPLAQFFEQSYHRIMLRHPQNLAALGLSETFGLENDELDDLSEEYITATYDLHEAILGLLREYDRASLSPEDRLTYDLYEYYLAGEVAGARWRHHNYPVHHFLGSYNDRTERLFSEYHTIQTLEDARDWVRRMSCVDDQVDQLMEGLELRSELGIVPPRFIIGLARERMVDYLGSASEPSDVSAESLPLFARFEEQVDELAGVGPAEKEELRAEAIVAIETSFVPAYFEILDYLDEVEPFATEDPGLWALPDGSAYYRHVLQRETTTDLSPDEIHNLGLAEVERIQAEMRAVFRELGYPEDAPLAELMDRAVDDGGYYNIAGQSGKDELLERYEAILAEVDKRIDDVFDIRPRAQLAVIGGPFGGYYVPAAVDGSRPGAFHVGWSGEWAPKYNMASLAYHEGIPGHHFQISIAQELDLPTLRKDIGYTAYAEGWALYAERLAHELGLYEDDPYGNLGRLQYELLRAVRLVADTGIHARRWTRDQARSYMAEALGDTHGRWSHEVDRYVVMPGQATAYKIGMLKVLELRQRMQDELGDDFDLKEFHRVTLSSGSLPLPILERIVEDYLAQRG